VLLACVGGVAVKRFRMQAEYSSDTPELCILTACRFIAPVDKTNEKAVLSQGNRAMPQLLLLV